MKHMIRNVILSILSITLFAFIYICVFKISVIAICILLLFLALYGFLMGWSWKSTEELKKYEQKQIHFELEQKDTQKILFFSLMTLSPSYLCVFLFSLIPLYTYEVWFLTVFPCIFVNCLPAIGVLDEYYVLTQKKLPFLAWFLCLSASSCLVGVITSFVILKSIGM